MRIVTLTKTLAKTRTEIETRTETKTRTEIRTLTKTETVIETRSQTLTEIETGLETNNRSDGRLPLIGVGIPLKPGVVLGLTAFPVAAVRYDLSKRIEGDPDYLLRTKGSGTWTDIAATFAARPSRIG